MKVLVACGAGMGTSQIMKLQAQKVFRELSVDCQITHTSIEEARSMAKNFDLVLVNQRFVETFASDVKVVGLINILDANEMKNKILESGFLDVK